MTSNDNSVNLRITGMTCASCVRRVERALGKVEGVETASVNFASETARVTTGAPIAVDRLVAAVAKAGYKAEEAHADGAFEAPADSRPPWLLVVGAVLGIPVVVISMAMDIADMPLFGDHQLTGWLLLAMATPIQVVLGWRFYRGAWTSLRHLNPNMDVLVALGTTVAYAYSAWVVIANEHRHMFFDVSVAVLVFITLGKYFEESSKRSTTAALRSLARLSARNAVVLRDGQEREVDAASLAIGDILVIRPGERVAADGLVVKGNAAVDESMITGESLPVERKPGDTVLAGTVNQDGLLNVRATAVGADSAVNRLARLVEEAQGSKAPIQRVVDQVAAVFVPAVVVVALVVFLGWGFLGGSWTDAMVYSVSVLVVACPCALGLATPTAIMVGTGIGAERGILIRNAEVLERIRSLDVIVLDKTGTLTEGRPEVTDIVPLPGWNREDVLGFAAAAESGSEHPLSRAVVDAAVEAGLEIATPERFESFVARGVRAAVSGREVAVGNMRLAESEGISLPGGVRHEIEQLEAAGRTVLLVVIDGEPAALLGIADAVKVSAPRAVAALKGLGLRVVMMTGDNGSAAESVAAAVGIDEVHAEVRPEDKLRLVQALQAEGLQVAMVGDGINDAPALAAADLAIAMSTGSDIAMEASDVTLLHGDVSRIAEAVLLGRSTLSTIRQNLVWAFGYNVVAIPIAALGLLNPIIAGAAMALSSVSVMANSLRLRGRARSIAREAGNQYRGSAGFSFLAANRGPALSFAAAALVLVVPLVTFTAIDRGWFGGDAGAGSSDERHLRVELSNWSVDLSSDEVESGEVAFEAVHSADHAHDDSEAGKTHDMVVYRVATDGSREMVVRSPELEAGESDRVTVNLEPGAYEVVCSVVEMVDGETVVHVEEGMSARLTVT